MNFTVYRGTDHVEFFPLASPPELFQGAKFYMEAKKKESGKNKPAILAYSSDDGGILLDFQQGLPKLVLTIEAEDTIDLKCKDLYFDIIMLKPLEVGIDVRRLLGGKIKLKDTITSVEQFLPQGSA